MDYHQPIVLTDEDRIVIAEAAKEIDLREVAAWHDLTPDQRAGIGFALCHLELRVGIYCVQQEFPELSIPEAQRLFLQRYYASKRISRDGRGIVCL